MMSRRRGCVERCAGQPPALARFADPVPQGAGSP